MSVCLQLEWNSYRPGSWEPQRFLFQQLPLLSPSVCPPSSPFTAPTEWTVNQDLGAFLFYTFPRDSCEIPSLFTMTIKKKIKKEIIRQDVIYLYCKCYLQTTDKKKPHSLQVVYMYSNCDNSKDDRCTNVGSLSPHGHNHTYSITCTLFPGCQLCSPGFQYFHFFATCALCWYWNIVFGHYWFIKKIINGLRGASQEHPNSWSFFPSMHWKWLQISPSVPQCSKVETLLFVDGKHSKQVFQS